MALCTASTRLWNSWHVPRARRRSLAGAQESGITAFGEFNDQFVGLPFFRVIAREPRTKTKIRKAKQQIAATAIPAQAQVLVVAYKENNTWVARRIVVLPNKGANNGTEPSNANPASTTTT